MTGKPPNSKWWDNYAQEDVVIIDESYGWLPYCEMLRLLDRYPCQVETKGGSVNFAPTEKIIKMMEQIDSVIEKNVCMRCKTTHKGKCQRKAGERIVTGKQIGRAHV